MQHKAARQREKDKRWDFTTTMGDRIVPVGYCRPYREDPELKVRSPAHYEKVQDHLDKFHGDGHETAEEAQECYKNYLLDFSLNHWEQNNQQRCLVCDEWTTHRVEIAYSIFVLCPEHAIREQVSERFHFEEIWES